MLLRRKNYEFKKAFEGIRNDVSERKRNTQVEKKPQKREERGFEKENAARQRVGKRFGVCRLEGGRRGRQEKKIPGRGGRRERGF